MIYDLADSKQLEEALALLTEFSAREKKIELKVYSPRRSPPQNRALHLLLGYMSNETGYTISECKELYKRMCGSLYTYMKPTIDGEDVIALTKSSTQLTEAEMAKSIEILYKTCAENGITLPLLTNEAEMRSIEAEIQNNSHYN